MVRILFCASAICGLASLWLVAGALRSGGPVRRLRRLLAAVLLAGLGGVLGGALVLMQVLSEAEEPLSQLRQAYEPYAASGEINYDVADQQGAMRAVEEKFSDAQTDYLDGLSVDFGDRWFNLRPSNTEPKVRLNVEAPHQEAVDQLVADVATIIMEQS